MNWCGPWDEVVHGPQMQKGIETERFGRSSDPRARVLGWLKSQYHAIANYMAAMTVAGYTSYVMKGWAAGVNRARAGGRRVRG